VSNSLAIIWIIIGAIFLYNITLISGKFEIVKESHALGPIFRTVWWHSVAGAEVIGVIAIHEKPSQTTPDPIRERGPA
jgi:hypothetical protein